MAHLAAKQTRIALVLSVATIAACEDRQRPQRRAKPAAAVAVAEVQRGPISRKRTYSGTLEAPDRIVVAAKVGGRVERIDVDLGDRVTRGQLVAKLEDDELRQLAAQTTAALAVARAYARKAESALLVARRSLDRVEKLRKRGINSEAQLDTARATVLERKADLAVARAEVKRAAAAEDAARIRLSYAQVTAEWSKGADERVVAGRQVSAGALVTENAPIISIVEIDPLTCVLFVAEQDYALVEVGQSAELVTDAYPGRTFEGTVARIAPVFDPGTRQARVELRVANEDQALKPGMFVRATLVLGRVDEAVFVPVAAITNRNAQTGVFVLSTDRKSVSWREVQLGIRDGERVQLVRGDVLGAVVTLGQQLLEDGSSVTIPAETAPAANATP